MREDNWLLNPSDFAFLWEECKRCFYLKVHEGFRRPSMAMPKIFTVIDREMKAHFGGKRTERAMPFLAAGTVDQTVSWVQSNPLRVPGHSPTCVIRGKLDTLIRFDDGSYGVIDFKTSAPREGHVQLYGRQLEAYATALEQAAPGHVNLSPVKHLGLLVYEPRSFSTPSASEATLSGGLAWIPIQRDKKAFFNFLGQILAVLSGPAPPESESCGWCRYREASRQNGR